MFHRFERARLQARRSANCKRRALAPEVTRLNSHLRRTLFHILLGDDTALKKNSATLKRTTEREGHDFSRAAKPMKNLFAL
jgi:hypothetical protein